LEWSSGEGKGNGDRGKVSTFASRVIDVVAVCGETNRADEKGNDIRRNLHSVVGFGSL
jgi:hypothetical protein